MALLDEILETRSVVDRAGNRLPLHSEVTGEEGLLLQRLVRELRPRTTLEVGLGYGISGLFICGELARIAAESDVRPRHIAIDPLQREDWDDLGLLNLERAGFASMVDFRRQTSHQALPDLEREGVRVQLAFIDGWHTFDHALVDFFLADRLLHVGGVMVMDDAQWPSVRLACRYIATNRAYTAIAAVGATAPLRYRTMRRLMRNAGTCWSTVRDVLREELVRPDADLGFTQGARCVAFRKASEADYSDTFAHRDF